MLNRGMLHAVACSLAVVRFSVDVGFLAKEQVSFHRLVPPAVKLLFEPQCA
jgi:hypothetical protein